MDATKYVYGKAMDVIRWALRTARDPEAISWIGPFLLNIEVSMCTLIVMNIGCKRSSTVKQ